MKEDYRKKAYDLIMKYNLTSESKINLEDSKILLRDFYKLIHDEHRVNYVCGSSEKLDKIFKDYFE
jgi:hypothetical protein